MPKRYLLLLAPGSIALVIAVAALAAGPVHRTQAFFAVDRQWEKHWPFERGRFAMRQMQGRFEPMVPVWFQVEPKIRMHLDPEDLVSQMILATGAWEPENWRLVQEHIPSGGTFVDIGAHIGYYSLKAAVAVGPAGKVIAVEPNPETVPKLRENLKASQANQVVVEPVRGEDADGVAVDREQFVQ